MLTPGNIFLKRCFDLFFSTLGIVVFFVPVLILILLSTISLNKWGLFRQVRIGKNGKRFWIFKIRTMTGDSDLESITVSGDPRIDRFGAWLRRTRLDEMPQLLNVWLGDMSLVGPRPDVPGYADKLLGDDRIILKVRPGITGPATLKYRNEEQILSEADDPVWYNDEIIWKDKTKINKDYVCNWSFSKDLRVLRDTFFT